MKKILFYLLACLSLQVNAHPFFVFNKSNDYTIIDSNNQSKFGKDEGNKLPSPSNDKNGIKESNKKPARFFQYYPNGKDIVCINGDNRYTRALYGTHTLYRLETSDRPIFASYNKAKSKNFRFYIVSDDKALRLDSTSYCEARYSGGRRSYIVKDKSWGDAEVRIVALASQFGEGALWQITTKGFSPKVKLMVKMCQTAKTKMMREGDYGLEPRSSYEASADEKDLVTLEWNASGETYLVFEDPGKIENIAKKSGRILFEEEEKALNNITSGLQFSTPDDFINTLGANLSAAADGLWDDSTWLHGCIGWRMPLCGWRAAYVGDVLGWNARAISHFNAYAKSQVTNVKPIYPHPSQDSTNNLARGEEKWGTQMYSNGYICRYPNRNDNMNHYDMNLNYIDELLWHFSYDADTVMMKRLWPVLKLNIEWEKRNWDPDGDHLYDAYCCIWASDALYYNSGAVTHSSAYNYRANKLMARIAAIIGEDPKPYYEEADAILKAMNSRLWIKDKKHWAEFQDFMGLKRLHESAALWSIYTPIDCGACSSEQAYEATNYVNKSIPHIPVEYIIPEKYKSLMPPVEKNLYTLSTSDWMPYDWSTNNVAHEEVANMALAYFEAGRKDEGFKLLKSDLLDEMFLGGSPGNFGQISYLDKARSEAYRDFGDNIGITSRAIVCGLFGIKPDALFGKCIIRPSFPDSWDSASVHTPYLSYKFHREGSKDIYEVTQHFTQPLQLILRMNLDSGRYVDITGNSDSVQTFTFDRDKQMSNIESRICSSYADSSKAKANTKEYIQKMGLDDISSVEKSRALNIDKYFNSNVDDIYKNEYLSPRSPYTTLEIPKQGIGQWCIPKRTAEINDSGLRAKIINDKYDTGIGVSFRSHAIGKNIVYTSLWDNYPDSVVILAKGKAKYAYFLLAGSTNNMQSRIDNAIIVATYQDGTTDTLALRNPINWCPIEQEYYVDDLAFWTCPVKPYRVHLGSGIATRDLRKVISVGNIEKSVSGNPDSAEPQFIKDGAAEILKMPLNKEKKLRSFTLRTLSNDVVVGVMAITLQK